jgi:hypothetical protein
MRFPASLVTTAFLGLTAPLARGEEPSLSLFDSLEADGNFTILMAAGVSVDLESSLALLPGLLSKSVG